MKVLLSIFLWFVSQSVLAQYPSQPIKIVVPFTAGTGMDTIARAVGPRLSEKLGQSVVVVNTPGASGNIGADQVAKSSPDGHTRDLCTTRVFWPSRRMNATL